ncbi:uncharacterized protein LOC105694813 isoform X2 [Orussus abietinus]|uniref:uncharacterized protein LOC105694813 isoform X2 n=1 Tax=Orussus abietinus TaxID=222816 RepID=UPI0006260F90|nr:uncharacterized protein LOC105694813 isoform X2 [Orussus abietinus]
MGACLSRCFNVVDPSSFRSYHRHSSMFFQESGRVEFTNEAETGNTEQAGRAKRLLSYLSLKRLKKKHGTPVTLELVEESGWPRGTSKYARLSSRNNASTSLDTPFQTLDARSLLKHQGCMSSTPASSLDLEWEHEGMPLPAIENDKMESSEGSLAQLSNNNSQPSSLTNSPWSRVSTLDSLEWDPVEADMVCVDIETEQLLTEIERLTDRALKETGEWTGTS